MTGAHVFRRYVILIAVAVVVLWSSLAFADYRKLTEKGNQAYGKDNMEEALKLYHEAEVEKPKEPLIEYNIGAALHNQNKYDDALQRFGRAVYSNDPKFQADAFYNMGNTFFRAEKYAEAITAYQKCLETEPDDLDAKYNLELARKKLKEQAQQQNQKQDQQQKQDQRNEDQKQDQQNQQEQQQQQQGQQQQQQDQQQNQGQDQQQEEQQQQEQQNQEEQSGAGEEEQKQSQQQPQQGQVQKEGMSKQDAERILNAISGDEKDLQKQMRRVKVSNGYKGKDW